MNPMTRFSVYYLNVCQNLRAHAPRPFTTVRRLYSPVSTSRGMIQFYKLHQGRSREFAIRGTKEGFWGTEIPSGVQGQSPGAWGLRAKPPEAGE